MNQISLPVARDLWSKLLNERTPLRVLLVTTSGVRVRLPGFIDSITPARGLMISVSGPPVDATRGLLSWPLADRDCEFLYGEQRELPEEDRTSNVDESVLILHCRVSGEKLMLFFTV